MSKEITVTETPDFEGSRLEDIIPEWLLSEALPEWLDGVDMAIVQLDPATAATMIPRNVEAELGKEGSNRRPILALIRDLARDMLADGWRFTHQGIAFDTTGRLIDGQHRLKALILAGETNPGIRIPFLIVTGVPAEAMGAIDIGRRRSLSDMLQMKGFPNTMQLASAARLVYLFTRGQFVTADRRYWSNSRPTRNELASFIETDREGLKQAVRIGGQSKIFTASAVAAAWYVIRAADTGGDIEAFFEQLTTGAHIGPGDPVFALRRWGINQRAKAGQMDYSWVQFAMIVKAFQYFRLGKRSTLAIWKSDIEAFPKP